MQPDALVSLHRAFLSSERISSRYMRVPSLSCIEKPFKRPVKKLFEKFPEKYPKKFYKEFYKELYKKPSQRTIWWFNRRFF
jgi:hypothetical protein